jgi:hypothetical protein
VPSGALIATEMLGPELMSMSTILGWDQDLRNALRAAGYQPKVYALEYIAMITTAPEQSARFYDLRLYEPADYIVVTGAVRDRYLAEPRRFRPQVAFYEALKRKWIKVQEFPSSGTGSDIVIYRNPGHDRPFAFRLPEPVPRLEVDGSSPLTGEEQALYYNMGLNYEGFGFLNHALDAYQQGLRFPSNRPERYTVMSQRLAGCLIRQKRVAEALAFLDYAAQGAPSASEAAALRRTRQTISVLEGRGLSPP